MKKEEKRLRRIEVALDQRRGTVAEQMRRAGARRVLEMSFALLRAIKRLPVNNAGKEVTEDDIDNLIAAWNAQGIWISDEFTNDWWVSVITRYWADNDFNKGDKQDD